MAGFRRSKWYAIIGVPVVGAACIVIATTVDPTNANPTLQYGLIFGVLGVFIIGLLFIQSRDLSKVSGDDQRAAARGEASGPRDVDDPTKMADAELWTALAVHPIDRDAANARAQMWGSARNSFRLSIVVFILIFLTVPPIYLFHTWITLYIGVPLIIACAIYGSIRAIGSGGEIDKGFERSDVSMRPLGLKMVERPDLKFQPRMPPMFGVNARLVGPLRMEGKRHGHSVSVNQEDNTSVVTVKASTPAFEAKAGDGGIKTNGDAPAEVTSALDAIPESGKWKGVEVHGGRGGVEVTRKGDRTAWLCDLWLAERLASKL
jgi:hypothetical protein